MKVERSGDTDYGGITDKIIGRRDVEVVSSSKTRGF